jgi:hypothetical protein
MLFGYNVNLRLLKEQFYVNFSVDFAQQTVQGDWGIFHQTDIRVLP